MSSSNSSSSSLLGFSLVMLVSPNDSIFTIAFLIHGGDPIWYANADVGYPQDFEKTRPPYRADRRRPPSRNFRRGSAPNPVVAISISSANRVKKNEQRRSCPEYDSRTDLPATLWPKHHRQETSRRLLHSEARDLNEAAAGNFPGLFLFFRFHSSRPD